MAFSLYQSRKSAKQPPRIGAQVGIAVTESFGWADHGAWMVRTANQASIPRQAPVCSPLSAELYGAPFIRLICQTKLNCLDGRHDRPGCRNQLSPALFPRWKCPCCHNQKSPARHRTEPQTESAFSWYRLSLSKQPLTGVTFYPSALNPSQTIAQQTELTHRLKQSVACSNARARRVPHENRPGFPAAEPYGQGVHRRRRFHRI